LHADVLAVPGLEKVRHEMIDAMMQYYKELLDQHKDDLTLRRELAEVELQLGILTGESGNETDGIALLRRALPDLEQLAQAAPGDFRIRRQIAFCLNNLGQLEGKVGQPEAARRTYEHGIALLNGVILEAPSDLNFSRQLAAIHGNLADLYLTEFKDRKGAREAYVAAMTLQKELVRKDPADVGFKNDLGTTYNNISIVTDDGSQASDWIRKALETRRELTQLEPTNVLFRRNMARTSILLGFHEAARGNIEGALNAHRESCRLLEQVVREAPQVIGYHRDLAWAQNNLGVALGTLGRNEEAKAEFEKGREIVQKLIHTNPNDTEYQNLRGIFGANIAEADQVLAKAGTATAATGATAAKPDGGAPSGTIGATEKISKTAPPR
jgi:tetratricopeptide (TPR) repeat protein